MNDGSTIKTLQAVVDFENFEESLLKKITTGAAVGLKGILVESQGAGQAVELQVSEIEIIGEANPDDINYVINSNNFTYNGINCALRNKLNSNTLQIVNAGGTEIIVDNIGNYVPNTGVVTINFFNPSNVTGGDTQIKLSAVPANQSAVAPTRNDYLLYDPNRSTTTAVIVSALN